MDQGTTQNVEPSTEKPPKPSGNYLLDLLNELRDSVTEIRQRHEEIRRLMTIEVQSLRDDVRLLLRRNPKGPTPVFDEETAERLKPGLFDEIKRTVKTHWTEVNQPVSLRTLSQRFSKRLKKINKELVPALREIEQDGDLRLVDTVNGATLVFATDAYDSLSQTALDSYRTFRPHAKESK